MTTKYRYACADFPGMEACPFEVIAESKEEVMNLVEIHAASAHGEDPSAWSEEDRAGVQDLIKAQ